MTGIRGAAPRPDPDEHAVRKMACFVALAYVFSWSWWVPMAVDGAVVEPGRGWPTHLPGLLGPALAAVLVTAAFEGRTGLRDLWARVIRWRVRARWYALIAGTAALALISVALSPDLTGRDFVTYSGSPRIGGVALCLLVAGAFGEEIGWRGFFADRLLDRVSVLWSAVIVWVVWAGWHLPLFWLVGNFRDFEVPEIVGWTVGILCGSVFLTWLYGSAQRSILIVALWHAAYNFTTATEATTGAAAAVSTTAVIAVTVILLCRPSLRRAPRRSPISG